VFYIQARLPEDLSDRFLELGAAGDELAIQSLAANEKISEIAEEAVVETFRWNNIRVGDDFFDFVQANHGERGSLGSANGRISQGGSREPSVKLSECGLCDPRGHASTSRDHQRLPERRGCGNMAAGKMETRK
jgi:hypothetical protein